MSDFNFSDLSLWSSDIGDLVLKVDDVQPEIERLQARVKELKCKLIETASELGCMIDMKNAELELGICPNDSAPPDYFDHQTVHEAMVLARG